MATFLNRLFPNPIQTRVIELLKELLKAAQAGRMDNEKFKQSKFALECLPLTTEQFATAANRLANAQGYLLQGEWGAASFELRLLLRSLPTELS